MTSKIVKKEEAKVAKHFVRHGSWHPSVSFEEKEVVAIGSLAEIKGRSSAMNNSRPKCRVCVYVFCPHRKDLKLSWYV